MKKYIYIIIVVILHLSITACNSNANIWRIIDERDSLKAVNTAQTSKLNGYGYMIEVINATLDSISRQENMIFIGNGELPVTKDDVQYNLSRFESVLSTQKERINRLEYQLRISNDSNAHSRSLIAHLYEQIEVKNQQIAQLRSELEKKNVNISQLQAQVASQRSTIDSQNATISELNTRNQKQLEALTRQDAILNNGYVLIGSKADLKRKGVITSKGTLVPDAVLDRSKFAKVNMKTWLEINITAKKPRVLSNMPTSSYELTTTGNKNFTLTIKNPSDFWRVSNYLIIQTD